MSKWNIAKEFACDYGHRVWTQKLDSELSLDCKLACRHLHGHRATIIVHLESEKLDAQGMVTDFHHLNWFKKFVDDVLDHKFIIDRHDPLLSLLLPGDNVKYIVETPIDEQDNLISNFKHVREYNYWIPNIDGLLVPTETTDTTLYVLWEAGYELREGIVIVDFVPTSENLAEWLLGIVQSKMTKLGVFVSHVEFFETPKSQSVYYQKSMSDMILE